MGGSATNNEQTTAAPLELLFEASKCQELIVRDLLRGEAPVTVVEGPPGESRPCRHVIASKISFENE